MRPAAPFPEGEPVLFSLRREDQSPAVRIARYFAGAGFALVATEGTGRVLRAAGLEARHVNKVVEGRPHVVDLIRNGEFSLIVNTTSGRRSLRDSYTIRREALLHKVTYYTTLSAARAAAEAHRHAGGVSVNKLQELHRRLTA